MVFHFGFCFWRLFHFRTIKYMHAHAELHQQRGQLALQNTRISKYVTLMPATSSKFTNNVLLVIEELGNAQDHSVNSETTWFALGSEGTYREQIQKRKK